MFRLWTWSESQMVPLSGFPLHAGQAASNHLRPHKTHWRSMSWLLAIMAALLSWFKPDWSLQDVRNPSVAADLKDLQAHIPGEDRHWGINKSKFVHTYVWPLGCWTAQGSQQKRSLILLMCWLLYNPPAPFSWNETSSTAIRSGAGPSCVVITGQKLRQAQQSLGSFRHVVSAEWRVRTTRRMYEAKWEVSAEESPLHMLWLATLQWLVSLGSLAPQIHTGTALHFLRNALRRSLAELLGRFTNLIFWRGLTCSRAFSRKQIVLIEKTPGGAHSSG